MKKLLYFFAFAALTGFASCSNDDNKDESMSFDDVTVNYGETYTIPNGKGLDWSTSNNLIATVDGYVVNAVREGQAIISCDKASFAFTVVPTLTLFQAPTLQWDAPISTVKSYMNSYPGVNLYSEDGESLLYQGSLNQTVVMVNYGFENNALTSAGIVINSEKVSAEDMGEYLNQRYVPVSVDDANYTFYYATPTADMAVAMRLTTVSNTVVYMISYVPMTQTKAYSDIKELFHFDAPAATTPEAKAIFNEIKANF